MVTTLTNLNQLALNCETLGLRPKIQLGDIFWVANRFLRNKAFRVRDSDDGYHAVIVASVHQHSVEVRILTSKVETYLDRGILYVPGSEARLRRTSVVLTHETCHQTIPTSAVLQRNYLGWVEPAVLCLVTQHDNQ